MDVLDSASPIFAPSPAIARRKKLTVPAPDLVDLAPSSTPDIFSNGKCRGLVPELGLKDRVLSVVHTFSKSRGMRGGTCITPPSPQSTRSPTHSFTAAFLTTPLIRHYIIGHARPMRYPTSPPYVYICSLDITSPTGAEVSL